MTKAFDSAMRLLCRREHGATELVSKLEKKGFTKLEAEDALKSCQNLDLQNEQRFVEMYARYRIRQGYGLLKITQELKIKGVEGELIARALKQEQDNWFNYALEVWQKKSKGKEQLSFIERQKLQSFLLYRGFPMDVITLVAKEFN